MTGFTVFYDKKAEGKPYIISFHNSIRVSDLSGREVNLGWHFLGEGLKKFLGDLPTTVLGVHANSDTDEIAVLWRQEHAHDAEYGYTVFQLGSGIKA